MQAVSDLLMVKANEAHPTERADLFGKRLVATIETEEGKRIAEALMKQLTGGDKMRARRMREDFWEFKPLHKIILAANHKPAVRGCDHAVWRRIKLVPFTVTIPDAEKDKELPDKLLKELAGILAWSVRGCKEWQESGLIEPNEVREATEKYRAEQNLIAAFLSACCVLQPELRIRVSTLHETYINWSGDKTTTQRFFSDRLREAGYVSERGTGGAYYWHGIGLPNSPPSEPDEYDQ
jgi:putative DNA primase/helicase